MQPEALAGLLAAWAELHSMAMHGSTASKTVPHHFVEQSATSSHPVARVSHVFL